MRNNITVVHYWAGCPKSANSKWQRFLSLIQRCRREGWKNYLVWSKMPEEPSLSEPFQNEECEIILQPRSCGNFDFGSIRRSYQLMRRLKCDIFHCHNDHTSPLVGAALAGVPVRIWSKLAMSKYHDQRKTPQGLHRLMLSTRLSCLCAHRVLAISRDVCNELVEHSAPKHRIELVHGAVDLRRFAVAPKAKIKQELGLNHSHFMISSVGRAIHRKSWDIAIKAFAEVQSKIPHVRMILVGSITSSEEDKVFRSLTELCRICKVSEYVHFLGHRHDFPEILKASDIFILPSRSEGLPGALLEAMAAGLPCITTNICGMVEVIEHGKNGLLFERDDSKQLAESLIRLIEDQALREKIASQASIRARQFSMEAYVDKVFNIYMSLLNGIVKENKCREYLD